MMLDLVLGGGSCTMQEFGFGTNLKQSTFVNTLGATVDGILVLFGVASVSQVILRKAGEESREGHFAECCFATDKISTPFILNEVADLLRCGGAAKCTCGARAAAEVVKNSMKRANSIALR